MILRIWCWSEHQNQSRWACQFHARHAGYAKANWLHDNFTITSRSACPACQTRRAKTGNELSTRREIWDLSLARSILGCEGTFLIRNKMLSNFSFQAVFQRPSPYSFYFRKLRSRYAVRKRNSQMSKLSRGMSTVRKTKQTRQRSCQLFRILRKPNSTSVLLFLQNNSKFTSGGC